MPSTCKRFATLLPPLSLLPCIFLQLSCAVNPTQCAFIPFAPLPFPFPSPVIHAASCAVCSFRLGAFTHTPCPHVTCLACASPCPLCTLCQPVAVALQQLRRIAASGFVATKAFVANNFTSLTRSPSISLSTALLQLECVLSADTMRKRERA